MIVFNTMFGKKQVSCIGMIDVHSIGTRLQKQNLGEPDHMLGGYVDIRGLCWSMGSEGVNTSWEFTDKKYHIVAQVIEKYIIGSKQTFIKKVNREHVGMLGCCWVNVDPHSLLWSSIMLSVSPSSIAWSCQREGGYCSYGGCLFICGCMQVYASS